MPRRRLYVIIGAILLAAASRLMPHPPNFTPIAAMALLGGAYLPSRRLALLVTLAALFVSDLFLGLHPLLPAVYGCFAASVWLGAWLRTRRTILPIAAAALASSILFYVVTNFAVWVSGTMYPKTVAGLAACYGMAIPFFRNTLLGDAFYTAALFGGLELLGRKLGTRRATEA